MLIKKDLIVCEVCGKLRKIPPAKFGKRSKKYYPVRKTCGPICSKILKWLDNIQRQ